MHLPQTTKEIYQFCKSRYYINNKGEKSQLYEDLEGEQIEELIDNDVYALKEFLGIKEA